MLTSVWRPRLVLGELDKSLERQENRRSCWRFLGQDILVCIINKMTRTLRSGKFKSVQLREIERIIDDNLEFLLDAWTKEQSKRANG